MNWRTSRGLSRAYSHLRWKTIFHWPTEEKAFPNPLFPMNDVVGETARALLIILLSDDDCSVIAGNVFLSLNRWLDEFIEKAVYGNC